MKNKKQKPEHEKDWRDYDIVTTYRSQGILKVIRKIKPEEKIKSQV